VIAEPLDPITLEVWWSRLVAIADEAATTLLRTAFSTIIRESNDYTVVLMNTSGQTIAECHAGIPVFAAGLCVARCYMRLIEVGTEVTVAKLLRLRRVRH
jgi:N-methylhydantoinase B